MKAARGSCALPGVRPNSESIDAGAALGIRSSKAPPALDIDGRGATGGAAAGGSAKGSKSSGNRLGAGAEPLGRKGLGARDDESPSNSANGLPGDTDAPRSANGDEGVNAGAFCADAGFPAKAGGPGAAP